MKRIVLALSLLSGCATDTDTDQVSVDLSDLSGYQARIRYFSDATYSTRVGTYNASCTSTAVSTGYRTEFALGFIEPCPYGERIGCERVDPVVWCPAEFHSCTVCP
jgi:hypothetical protein